jgi:hypothetical protein
MINQLKVIHADLVSYFDGVFDFSNVGSFSIKVKHILIDAFHPEHDDNDTGFAKLPVKSGDLLNPAI